jgi:hypothetical protein
MQEGREPSGVAERGGLFADSLGLLREDHPYGILV